VRTQLLHPRPELRAAHGGGHTRARHAAELNRRGAHATRRSVHEQVLAGAQAGLGKDGVVCGGEYLGEPARLGPVEWLRNGHRGTLVHQGKLGLPASPEQRHHAVTLLEAAGARPEGCHLTRQLETGDVRRRSGGRWVPTPALEHVGAVQARCPHSHQQFALARLGIRPRLHDQASVLDGYRPHPRGMYWRLAPQL
jgi:hypothetical protein